jgi:flavin-dependent oxidoreductase
VPAALLYSCRTREDVIYHYHKEISEIAQSDAGFMLRITLTRERPPGWSGALGRIDPPMVRALLERLGGMAFVCGSDGFVEAASVLLMQAGGGDPHRALRCDRGVGPLSHTVLGGLAGARRPVQLPRSAGWPHAAGSVSHAESRAFRHQLDRSPQQRVPFR